MIILHRQPQIGGGVQLSVAAKGEKLAVTAGEETRIYDFSTLEIGQFLETMDDYIMSAVREDGVHVGLLWPIGENASEEERFPEPEVLEDATKLPSGEEVALSFAWPEPAQPTLESLGKGILVGYEMQAGLYEENLVLRGELLDTQLALAEMFEMFDQTMGGDG